MVADPAAELLGELRRRGIEVQAQGEGLRYRPKSAVGPDLLARMAQHKGAILALLAGKADEAPIAGELLAVRTLDDLLALNGPDRPPSRCYACRESRWWRLRRGGPWVCGRCHDPAPPPSQIEWWGEGGSP